MAQYGFYFDGTRCTGCKTCELACKDVNGLGSDFAFRQVYEYEKGSWTTDETGAWKLDGFTYYVSSGCNHCENPACTAACPVGSMVKDEATGLVYNDPATCIGCGACAAACPYGAPKVDESGETPVSRKCDACHARVEAGRDPVCVEACTQRALEFGDIEDLRARYGTTASIAPLPDPTLTGPSVVILPPACAESWDDATGDVVNTLELV